MKLVENMKHNKNLGKIIDSSRDSNINSYRQALNTKIFQSSIGTFMNQKFDPP
jgi:hypothetical protein